MRKIYIIMGKSSSGKDSIYRKLLEDDTLNLKPIVLYTTRPCRVDEKNGKDYFFVSENEMHNYERANKIIEKRKYNTIHGVWYYFTADDGQIDFSNENDYLTINTLMGYVSISSCFGKENVIPLYIDVEDGIRLSRALERERKQPNPEYVEMCRRYIKDSEDFSDDKLLRYGINHIYYNIDFSECIKGIKKNIKENKKLR